MPAIMPDKPGEIVVQKPEPSVANMIDRFKSKMAEGDKPAPAAVPAKPAAPAPEPAKPEVKADDKSVVPKLEPLPEKKVEAAPVKPADDPKTGDVLPEKLSHKNFKVVLGERDEFKNKYEAAEKKAKELEARIQEQSRPSPEFEEAKKQLAEKDQFINQFMLEQSDEFQNAFTRPIEQTIQDAKDIVGGEKGERLAEILRAPDGKWRTDQIKAFVTELEDDYEKGVVRDSVNALRKLERGRKDELQKAGTNIQALKQLHLKRQEESQAQQKEARERLTNYALEVGSKSLPEFRETEDADHNVAVSENKALLKKFLSAELPPEEFGRMAVWAVRGIRSLALEKQLSEKVATLEAEIAKLSAASPDLDGGGGGVEGGEKADTPEKAGNRFVTAMASGVPQRR